MAASQGLLLGILLFFIRNKSGKNIALSFYILFLSLDLLFKFLYSSKLILNYPHLAYITEPINMLYGALIVVYTNSTIQQKIVFRKKDIVLLLPFITYIIYYASFYFQNTEDKLFDVEQFLNAGISFKENIFEWIAEVSVNVIFLTYAVLILNKYHRKIKEFYSDFERRNFVTLRNLIIISIFVYSLEIILIVLSLCNVQNLNFFNNLLYIVLTISLYALGYYGIISAKTEINVNNTDATTFLSEIETIPINRTEIEEVESENTKYKKSSLKQEDIESIKNKLILYMYESKPHLNPDIRIKELAELLGVQSHHLSQVINDCFSLNFFEFINKYRVEEAIKFLKDDNFKNYTLTAIGFEVGFNSKSAFYSAFKKTTGTTPAKY